MNRKRSILDRLLAEALQLDPQFKSSDVSHISNNGQDNFTVKLSRQGLRDVRDTMLATASYLGTPKQKNRRAFVLISLTRSSPEHVREEWNAAKAIMLPEIARRLHLIAIVNGKTVIEPSNPEMQSIADKFARVAVRIERQEGRGDAESPDALWPNAAAARQITTSWKHIEIEKVLLHRWLLQEGPMGIGELQAKVGCSYPTVQNAIKEMAKANFIRRGRERSVELTKYPRERWAALVTSSKQVYSPFVFVDVTDERNSPEALLRRLYHMRNEFLPELAVGGVSAGRYWNPDFDLNGTPRLDLVLHAPARQREGGNFDLDFVRKLDPALKLRRGEHAHRSPVLVVHPIHRQESLFVQNPKETIPWADPVETILHLNDLGLMAQAGELVSKLRPETRFPAPVGARN